MDYLFDTVNYNLDTVNGSIVLHIWHLQPLITISPVWFASDGNPVSNGNPVVKGPNNGFLCWAMEGNDFGGGTPL